MPNPFKRNLLVSGILAIALAGCSKPLSHDELLEQAQVALAEGKLNAAVINAKTALQQDARSAEGRRLLGEIYLRQRQLDDAAIEFEKSLESVEDPSVAVLYAEALLDAGQAQKLVDLHESPDFTFAAREPVWLASVARAQAMTGDTFTAADTLSEAMELTPENPHVRLAQAFVAVRHSGEIDKAEAILRELTENHPEFAEAWSLYGGIAQAQGNTEIAEQAFARAGSLNSYRLNDRLGLVAALIEQGKFEAAGEELEQLERIIPDHPGVNQAQARILLEGGGAGGALEKLAKVLNVAPNHLPSIYLAASANYREGNLATAEGQLIRVLGSQPGNVNARQMLAAVYLKMGEPERTVTIARKLLEDVPMNVQTMNILALALATQGMHGASAEVYRDLARLDPESASVQMELGTALARSGDIASGIEALQAAKELDPASSEIRYRLTRAHIASGDKNAADQELAEFRTQAPGDPLPSVIAAQLALEAGDREQAVDAFGAALKLDPTNVQARGGLVSLAMLDDDSGQALDLLKEGLDAQPGDLNSLLKMAAVHEQRGEMDEMVATLRRAIAAHPKALEPRLGLARYKFREGQAGETVTLLTAVRDDYNSDPRVYQLLTGAFLAVDQPGAAVTSGRRLVELLPDNPRALLLAAQAERMNNDLPAAERLVRHAVDVQPDNVEARKMLVEVLLQQNKLAETSEQMALLPESVMPEPQQNLSRGRLALAQGDLIVAEELLRKAHAAQPSGNSLVFLSMATWQQGKTAESYAMLESWLEQNPEDTVVLNQLGSFYVSDARDDDAVRVYDTLHGLNPEDAAVLNNLAWVHRKTDTSRALKLVEEALQAAPGSPPILDTHAMILLESGDFGQALAVNQKALDAAPDYPQFRYHRARILVAAGDKAAAIKLLESLVADTVMFAEKSEAEALLAELRDG